MKFKLTWLCNILFSSSQFSWVVPQYVAILDAVALWVVILLPNIEDYQNHNLWHNNSK